MLVLILHLKRPSRRPRPPLHRLGYGHLYPEADLILRERLDAIWSASGGGS
jgi:hypothetical protein